MIRHVFLTQAIQPSRQKLVVEPILQLGELKKTILEYYAKGSVHRERNR
jgi:hypothetical protein